MAILTDADDEAYRGIFRCSSLCLWNVLPLGRGQCLPYSRSFVAPRENCSLGVREQGNLVSSFLDASHIYGSNKDEAASLRDSRGIEIFNPTMRNDILGLLKSSPQSQRLELLPSTDDARSCSSSSSLRPCFKTASTMSNLLPTG